MSHFNPFHIVHIDTREQMRADAILLPLTRNTYVVLWWRNVPLCHLFLFAAQTYSKAGLLNKLYAALKETLSDYASKTTIERLPGEIETAWLGQDQKKWNNCLEELLGQQVLPQTLTNNISVIICTRSRPVFLQQCLAALQQQTCPPAEIIVVDNAPLDDSTKKVTASFPGVRYYVEKRAGLDYARNTGAKAATGEILAYTDDDVVLHPLWTCHIARAFADERIMAVTGLIFAAEINSRAQFIFENFWSFNRGYAFRDYDGKYFSENLAKGVPVWEIGAGANMAFRKLVFERIGYFDERLDVGAAGCNGDSEFWYRILAEGYSIRYTPLAIAYHKHRTEMKALKKQIYFYMRGFTAALHIQHERYQHKGNLDHLYKHLLPFYITRLPRAFRHGFQNNFTTYFQEVKGIFSGMYYYHKHRKKAH